MNTLPPLLTNRMTAVWGSSGSGKTHAARLMLEAANLPCVLAISAAEYHTTTLSDVMAALAERRSIAFSGNTPDERIAAVHMAYLYSTPDHPVYVVCDEAPDYMAEATPALRKISNMGRHAGLGVMLIGQRPTGVHAAIRSNAARTIWLRLSDAADVRTAAQQIGNDAARDLSQFVTGQFLIWPPLE